MNLEWLLPTYKHATFIAALNGVRKLQKEQHIPSSSEFEKSNLFLSYFLENSEKWSNLAAFWKNVHDFFVFSFILLGFLEHSKTITKCKKISENTSNLEKKSEFFLELSLFLESFFLESSLFSNSDPARPFLSDFLRRETSPMSVLLPSSVSLIL